LVIRSWSSLSWRSSSSAVFAVPRMSRATALSGMAQQLSVSLGVAFGASLLALTAHLHGGSAAHLTARDFSPAFFVVGGAVLCSLFFFVKLSKDEGAELRQRS